MKFDVSIYLSTAFGSRAPPVRVSVRLMQLSVLPRQDCLHKASSLYHQSK